MLSSDCFYRIRDPVACTHSLLRDVQSVQLSDASSEVNNLVDNVKDAIEERISEIDVQGSVSNLLQQYNIDDSSISSVASTYEGLDPGTQVDV